ncbi:YqaE/Pmp3 family membrane protein [Peribacillus frigoritolerans]
MFTILYLIAILFPPLAVLLAGKPIQSVLNLVLTLFFYVPGLIHAILVVHDKKADKRMKRQAAFIAKLKRTTK